MKTIATWLIGLALILPLHAQQAQPSVKRHPGDVLRYRVTFDGGEIGKITSVGIRLYTPGPFPESQPGLTNGFNGPCAKSASGTNVWECSLTIPGNVIDGNYTLDQVNIAADPFSKQYAGNFDVPVVPIENPKNFNPPKKVTVTPQP
jgi:hypothetical protein